MQGITMQDKTTDRLIEALVPEKIRRLQPYHVPDASGMTKLDAMENPYQLPEALLKQWLQAMSEVDLNRYPDPSARVVKQKLAGELNLAPEQLILGNGSDEIIQMLMLLLGGEGKTILSPSPSFSMYRLCSVYTHCQFQEVSLTADFSLDTTATLRRIEKTQPSCIFIAYPNNPTGNCFSDESIQVILENAPGVVVIDEAYFAFCQKSYLTWLDKYANLMVLRTLSKSGLAGLRLGCLAAAPQWIAQLEKIRLPYNINSLTQASVSLVLDNMHVLDRQAEQLIALRSALFARLAELPGLSVFPSEANFILFRANGFASALFEYLKSHNVLIKNVHQPRTLLVDCLRVTVGSEQENRRFIEIVERFYSER
jgi:histidinol-phosphate aminotransferase